MIKELGALKIKRIKTVDASFAGKLNKLFEKEKVWDKKEGEKFLKNAANALWVAFSGEEAVGFITAHRLQRFDKRRAEVLLYEVGVKKCFRRKGVGQALVEIVKEWAKEIGADEIWVLTEKGNTAARALYKSTGGKEEAAETRMFLYQIK